MPKTFWFTTHYPPIIGGRDTLHIYVKEADHVLGIAAHDPVLIYEFNSGPSLLRDGEVIRRERGWGGVICEAEVLTGSLEETVEATETYPDGSVATWRWVVRTGHRTSGHISRQKMNEIFGYKPGNFFRGFNGGRGIKPLDSTLYNKLRDAFNRGE